MTMTNAILKRKKAFLLLSLSRKLVMGFSCCTKWVTKVHLAGTFLFILVLYNEWLEYGLQAHDWVIQEEAEEEYVRVLIAADPQILSEKSKLSYPLNIISTWDADRFISKTFHMALEKAHPEVVIFLGDLVNDGSISNDKEFSENVQHFKDLMEIPEYVKKVIYVPGDNDIGGEVNDPVTATKMKRFYEAFNQDIHTSYKFIDFVQLNAMDQHTPNISMNIYPALEKRGRIRILLSHIPLLPISRKTFKKVIVSHEPSLIFSGHEHESFHFIGERKDALANEFWPLYAEGNVWVTETLSDHLHEITVPTCSYRMGKEQYGYGIAIITRSGVVHYMVKWSPSRFSQLWSYAICATLFGIVLLYKLIFWVKDFMIRSFHLVKYHYT